MTIRARLTLWYAGILFASVLVIGVVSYQELVVEKRRELKQQQEARAKSKSQLPPDVEAPEEVMDDLAQIGLFWALPAALVGLAGGWWLMRKALAPVAALAEAARKVNESNLRQSLPRTGNRDEIDRLAEVLNSMTSRLGESFQRIREFTLHASHELKTPLTILHGEIEAALEDKSLSPSHQERLLSQLDEVQRLAKIVDGLSLLTKADAGQIQLAREEVRLDELLQDAAADTEILAQAQNIQVAVLANEPIVIWGDRHRLRQLLLNLTDNAVKYNYPKGKVSLALRRIEAGAEITISNTGPGVPQELQSRIFDPFFRGDASHSNTVEGCGLGLSIAQWIVKAHGGTIRFVSVPGEMTTVTVCLPADLNLEMQRVNAGRKAES